MSDPWQTISPPSAPPATPRGPSTGFVLLLALLVALVGAGGIHLVLEAVRPAPNAVTVAAPAEHVVVPDLVGLPVAGARSRAKGERFLLHVVGTAPAGVTDALRVKAQRPLAGSLVRVDDVVEVRVGDGEVPAQAAAAPPVPAAATPERAIAASGPPVATARPVPDVAGLDVTEASRLIAAAGYTVGQVDERVSDGTAGLVIAQAPAAGTSETAGTAVALTLATAGATTTVPYLGHISADDARGRLEAAGFKARFDSVFSPSVRSGDVILTKPAAGADVRPGASILVYVAE